MASNELFEAITMFNNSAKELATGRTMRSAAEQAKLINDGEQDQFAKRQQLTQLGNQLALELGAIGAPVSQIQTAFGAVVPKQFQNAQDMYAEAAQMPAALEGDRAALQSRANVLREQEFTKAQEEANKTQRLGLWGSMKRGGGLGGAPIQDLEKNIPSPVMAQITSAMKKAEDVSAIRDSLYGFIESFDSMPEATRIQQADLLLKGLNSSITQTSDAVGKEEVGRLGKFLELAILPNAERGFSGGSFFGRDTDKFRDSVAETMVALGSRLNQIDDKVKGTYKKYTGLEDVGVASSDRDLLFMEQSKQVSKLRNRFKNLSPDDPLRPTLSKLISERSLNLVPRPAVAMPPAAQPAEPAAPPRSALQPTAPTSAGSGFSQVFGTLPPMQHTPLTGFLGK
jgi:hypothetical protein